MTKRILALVMALCLVFALAACKDNKTNDETTTEPVADANGEVTPGGDTDDTQASEGASEDSTDASQAETETDKSGNVVDTPTNGGSQGGQQGGTQQGSKKPSTKEEIVTYFNTAINDVKPHAKSITRKSQGHYLAGSVTGLPSGIEGIFRLVGGVDKFINDQLTKNSTGSATFTSAADKNANFPVENQSWSSKLTPADVASATCTEANGVYTITIKTVADAKSSNVQYGVGHNPKAFSVVKPSVVNDQFKSGILASVARSFKIGTAEMSYPSSTIVVKVNAATGKVTAADYDMKWTINLPLGDNVVVLPLGTKSSYTVAY